MVSTMEGSTVVSSLFVVATVQVSPDDLKARQTYLRQQRDRLPEMKEGRVRRWGDPLQLVEDR